MSARRSKGSGAKKKSGGMLMGMRSGFRKGARAAVGVGGQKSKKTSLASTIVTVLLLIAVVAFLLRRQGII